MTIDTNESIQNDPLYRSVVAQLQKGEWDDSLNGLNQLMEKYPLDQDLRSMRQDIQLRAKFDQEELIDEKTSRRKNFRIRFIRTLVILGVVLLVGIAARTYFNSFQVKLADARTSIEMQMQDYQLSAKLTNANQYINAYRPTEAEALLVEIRQENAQYPGLEEAQRKIQALQALETSYQEAMNKKAAGDLVGALEILRALDAEHARYKDVSLQLKEIQREYILTDNIQLGDALVAKGDWTGAIEKYEEVRYFDPTYERDTIEERLFNTYLGGAQFVLDNNPESLDSLLLAQDYFNKALSLRPQNKIVLEQMEEARQTVGDRLYNYFIDIVEKSLIGQSDSLEVLKKVDEYLAAAESLRPDDDTLKTQRMLARNFVLAQDDFIRQRWDDAIDKLTIVYNTDIGYASGTARQALYDAYILRGDVLLRSGKTQRALEDYQKAVEIAQLSPENRLRLFEAQVKIGNTMGIMGNHQGAVYQFRAALDEANLNERIILDPELALAVANAEQYASRGSYSYAYSLFSGAMDKIIAKFGTLTHVVEEGDYVTKLANLYNTTVSAILLANNLTDPSQLKVGDRVIIPVIP